MSSKKTTPGCTLIDDCPFYKERMARMPRSTEIMKEMFCKNEYAKCARYLVYRECGREHIPIDLFPNEFEKGRKIVAQCKEKMSE